VVAASAPGIARSPLADGIIQFIAALPVYRTYLDGRPACPHPEDIAMIDRAVANARAFQSPDIDAVELVADVLRGGAGRTMADDPERLRFAQRLQQTSGPAAARGVEDTALYQYVPLASRNEVGGAPDRPLDDAVRRLHDANVERVAHWPSSLACTNTHDTKRSADVRSRLEVLSEMPNEWERAFRRWRRINAGHRRVVKGRLAPDINTEYLLYQTLLGIWPAPRPGRTVDDVPLPDRDWRATARERLQRYMLKAVREAKTRTSWTDPDADFEKAVEQFIADILEPTDLAPFLSDLARFVALIAPAGHWNALSRVLVHLTSPGVADLYQGDELWKFVLVDPDNRRGVDYEERITLLADIDRAAGCELDQVGADPADPRLKLMVTARLLRTRRAHPGLFIGGSYLPLEVAGEPPARVFAFSRSAGHDHAIVLAPRLSTGLADGGRTEPAQWGTSSVAIPQHLRDRSCKSVIDGRNFRPSELAGGTVALSAIFAKLPLALLLWDY
jgi:(1->4)-alpha-D-glucan 1-alpha-D-glucosylmutase